MTRPSFRMTLAAALLLAAPASGVEIGVMGAANPDITGTPPAAAARLLATGDALFAEEEVVSGPDGLGHAMFPDQTSLTIAPNSRVVLDRYVYDPATAQGAIGVTLARGAMRLIGGRITKTADAQLRTATATIGVRGGAAVVEAAEDGSGLVTLLGGEYARVAAGGQEVVISRPGGQARIAPGGAGVVYAGVARGDAAAALVDLFSTPGNGGASPDRTPGSAAGLAPVNSFERGLASAEASSTTGFFLDEPRSLDDIYPRTDIAEVAQGAVFSDAARLDDLTGTAGFVDIGGDGLVRGQLTWADSSDLDLHLILPGGAGEVFFANRSITFNNGGATATLDADNLGGIINVAPDLRVENIVVSGEDIPAGTYVFFVDAFSLRSGDGSAFTLTVTGDGGATTDRLDGVLTTNGQDSAPLNAVVGPGG